jgi:hypothetical protein
MPIEKIFRSLTASALTSILISCGAIALAAIQEGGSFSSPA